MTRTPSRQHPPDRVIVIGAGAVGLSCAWSLQEHGIDVSVIDRQAPAAGASWGNAGYLSPTLAVPLPEPSLLRSGLRAMLRGRNSPVCLPPQANRTLVPFLSNMIRQCTTTRWRRAMAAYVPMNDAALEAFDIQQASGVSVGTRDADVLACFRDARHATGLLHELQEIAACGQPVDVELLTAGQAHDSEPALSSEIRSAVRIRGQRYLDPIAYVTSLAEDVRARGGKIIEDCTVTSVDTRGGRVLAACTDGTREAAAVVLATGAWLPTIASRHGVRVPMHAGRGYSFTVPTARPLHGPVYFPAARLALTPRGERVKLAGIMEFRRPDDRLDPRRIDQMTRATRGLLSGVDWCDRADTWVGPRPLTSDGLPLIGRSGTPGVYIAGGHGMWGMTLGPLTGALLAEQVATGRTPPMLVPFDPCR